MQRSDRSPGTIAGFGVGVHECKVKPSKVDCLSSKACTRGSRYLDRADGALVGCEMLL